MDRIIANWEGTPECISYDDLPVLLTQKNWVPSGKAHVLAWLAFGAPNAGVMARFGGTSPKKLFQDTVAAM